MQDRTGFRKTDTITVLHWTKMSNKEATVALILLVYFILCTCKKKKKPITLTDMGNSRQPCCSYMGKSCWPFQAHRDVLPPSLHCVRLPELLQGSLVYSQTGRSALSLCDNISEPGSLVGLDVNKNFPDKQKKKRKRWIHLPSVTVCNLQF